MMSDDQVKRAWESLLGVWKFSDSEKSIILFNTLMWYFMENAPSQRGVYGSDLEVGGKKYPASKIPEVLGSDTRRFARPCADHCHQLLLNDPPRARALCARNAYPAECWAYCFDFSDKCKDLPPGTRALLQAHKRAKMPSVTPFASVTANHINPLGSATDVQPELQGASYRHV